ncbi:MAG: peptidylprolyl isomerase [Candidatus Pacearchaeota archaeon]
MLTKKGDFIELEFTARSNEGVFDTTDSELAKKLGYSKEVKPLKLIIGEGMVIKGLDAELEGKEIGKEYSVEIEPGLGFGERKQELIKIVPLAGFERKPREGEILLIEGVIARVAKIESGRVTLDFNHPLAGKRLHYKFKITKLITDEVEKVKAILDYFGLGYDVIAEGGEIKIKGKPNRLVEELIKKYIKVKVSFNYGADSSSNKG